MAQISAKRRTPARVTSVDTRERILRAALGAFSDNGFDGAKTRDIADRAGVKLGLLQYHFGGKEKLWRAAVDRAFAELHDGLDTVLIAPPNDDELHRFRSLIGAYVRFVARNPEFVRLMHEEGKRRGRRMRWLVDRHVAPIYNAMLPVMRAAQEQGVLPPDVAPIHVLYAFAGAVGIIFHQAEEVKRLSGIDPFDAAVVEAHVRTIEHLFLGRG